MSKNVVDSGLCMSECLVYYCTCKYCLVYIALASIEGVLTKRVC